MLKLGLTPEATPGATAGSVGLTSGLGSDVPRLDRWVLLGEVVAGRASFRDFEKRAHGSVFGSGLGTTGNRSDSSHQTAAHLVDCMGWRLQKRTQQVMRRAKKTGIAMESLPALYTNVNLDL